MNRNPGACCLYTVTGYSHHEKPDGRIVFRTGPALRVVWYTQGRPALRSEVLSAIEASLLAIRAPGSDEAIERRVAELVPA